MSVAVVSVVELFQLDLKNLNKYFILIYCHFDELFRLILSPWRENVSFPAVRLIEAAKHNERKTITLTFPAYSNTAMSRQTEQSEEFLFALPAKQGGEPVGFLDVVE